MVKTKNRRIAALVTAIIALILLAAGPTPVRPSMASNDDEIKVKSDITSRNPQIYRSYEVDGNRIIIISFTGTFVGEGLNGDMDLNLLFVRRTDSTGTFHGENVNTCTRCVDGHTGSLIWEAQFDGEFVDGVLIFKGKWGIIKGTGDLEGARGGGVLFTIAPGVTHYSGKIHVVDD